MPTQQQRPASQQSRLGLHRTGPAIPEDAPTSNYNTAAAAASFQRKSYPTPSSRIHSPTPAASALAVQQLSTPSPPPTPYAAGSNPSKFVGVSPSPPTPQQQAARFSRLQQLQQQQGTDGAAAGGLGGTSKERARVSNHRGESARGSKVDPHEGVTRHPLAQSVDELHAREGLLGGVHSNNSSRGSVRTLPDGWGGGKQAWGGEQQQQQQQQKQAGVSNSSGVPLFLARQWGIGNDSPTQNEGGKTNADRGRNGRGAVEEGEGEHCFSYSYNGAKRNGPLLRGPSPQVPHAHPSTAPACSRWACVCVVCVGV
jgi:hypothetical protein